MITTAKLKQFKETLDIIQIEVNELLRVRKTEQLFNNSNDYHDSLIACKECPADYYKLRFFDTEIILNFHHQRKIYYIHFDTVNPKIYYQAQFQQFKKDNKLKGDLYDKNYYIEKDTSFENVVLLFQRFCLNIIEIILAEGKLFYYQGL